MEEKGGISILEEVADAGEWKAEHKKGLQELEAIRKHYREEGDLESLLDSWADPETTGERLMSALSAYYEGFFIEEERRIRPALMQALTEAKRSREKGLPVVDLLEQLSQGVRLDEPFTKSELVLAPSYWATPLLIFGEVSPERQIILFGARSPEESLVPGETVPESLLRILKALSDPTRLRILRYLSEEPLTPTQLSQRLRLRSSTVVHHLNTLRLATLVQLKVGPGKEKYYSAREESVEAAHRALQEFLSQEEVELPASEEATP
jgi:DNA-binding transcriptional ArsR family regulator